MKTTSAALVPTVFVAIDWGDTKHAVALFSSGMSEPEHATLGQTPEALAAWIAGLRQRFGDVTVAVTLEQKRGALINALAGHEFLWLYPVNPKMVSDFRKAFRISGAKDDPTDAALLLELLLKHRDRLKRAHFDDIQTRLLTSLVEDRRGAVDERTRLVEILVATLKTYYPQFIGMVGGEFATRLACELLIKYPDFGSITRARPETIRRFFYARKCTRGDVITRRLAVLASSQPLSLDPAVLIAGSLKAKRLARQLLALLPVIADYDQRIKELFAVHPDAEVFRSFPGAGPNLAPRLLCAFGADRSRWARSLDIATFSGIAPVVARSGKSFVLHQRWACPRFLRQTFHEFSGSSLLFCPWAKAYYKQLIARGKGHHAAVRALAFKWIRILHRCWRDHVSYDESLYAPARLLAASTVPNPM